jgi:hypothetical protein
MRMRNTTIAALTAAAPLSACAQAPTRQAFNREAAAVAKAVVVTQAPNEEGYGINVMNHPGQYFGLIGGLVQVSEASAKMQRLNTAVDPAQTRLRERFGGRLRERLGAAGYESSAAVVPSPLKDDQFLANVKQQTQADLFVRVELDAAYLAQTPTSDYVPHINVSVKAFDSKTGAALYEERFSYALPLLGTKAIHIEPDPRYRFKDMEALVADPQKARDGWFAGVDAISEKVALDLRKP